MQRSKWLIFILVALAQFMVVLDIAITNIALPSIKQELHFSADTSLQWVITAYALTFGGFLLLGGRAADFFGRRRTLLWGMLAFTVFSLLIGITRSADTLIVLRALQGMAAAFMSPSALSIVLVTFGDTPDRNKALGYWTLVATGGAAVGVLLGGTLTEFLGWRWNFFINVPIGILMLLAISRFVPSYGKEDTRHGLDLLGATLITASLVTQVFAFSQAPSWGWLSLNTLGTLAIAALLMVAFLLNEGRIARRPLMPLTILKIRNVLGGNLMMAPLYATMLGTFFTTTLYIQSILHFSPVVAGLCFLPFPVVMGFTSSQIPKLVARYGYKPFLMIGPLLVIIALLWLSRITVDSGYFSHLFPAFIIMPLGIGSTFMPIIAAATSGVQPQESGLASGLVTTSQQMGGALGLAVISSVASTATASALRLGPSAALVHGFSRAFLAAAAFMVYAVVLAIIVIKQHPRPVAAPVDPAA